ncbi:cytochrome P450 [Nocardia sp. NPDC003693]
MLRALTYINRSAYSHPLVERTVFRTQRAQHLADVAFVNAEVDAVIAARQRAGAGLHDDLLERMLTAADPGYFRKANSDTLLGGRYPFEKGEWVFIVLLQLHRHERWGADPESFDPDRFLPERIRARHPELYRPFGVGLRACIGRQFAYHEIVLVLATILANYDLEPDPDYRLRVKETITLKPDRLRLKVSRRG